MHRILLLLTLISFLSVISCKSTSNQGDGSETTTGNPDQVAEQVKDVSNVRPVTNVVMIAEAFEKQLQDFKAAGTEFQLVDARTPDELTETGLIEGAINLDWRNGQFQEEYSNLDKDQAVMVYCRSGGRSGEARNFLIENGFKEVYDLAGGITGWIDQGKSVVESGE